MNSESEAILVDVFVQRCFATADARARERPDTRRIELCLDLHGILLERSYLARDGERILCHFRAPDAESLRVALHVAGVDYDALWTGVVRNIPGAAEFVLVVERVFDRPVSKEQERSCRARMARRLQDLGVEPARVLLSRCGKRILWLCRASTPAAVTAAQTGLAGQGLHVWCCETVSPKDRWQAVEGGVPEPLAERA